MKKTTKCETCGCEFEYDAFGIGGREFPPPRQCQRCFDSEKEAEEASNRSRIAQEEFFRVCPPLYRETDIKRLPRAFTEVIAKWEWNPEGVGFVGKPGMRKTRAAFLLLKGQIKQGRSAEAITATDFGMLVVEQFSNDEDIRNRALEQMMNIRKAEILLLDDLGKGKMTERAELELYALLEYRTSHMLPTIWTANTDTNGLKLSMSKERGDAIIRRLEEFSKLV